MMNSDLDLSNKILNHNDEQLMENALLANVTPRKKFYDDHSDESETSRFFIYKKHILPQFNTLFSFVPDTAFVLTFPLEIMARERLKIFQRFWKISPAPTGLTVKMDCSAWPPTFV